MRFLPLAVFIAILAALAFPLRAETARPQIVFQLSVKGTPAQVSRVQRLAKVAERVVNSEKYEQRTKAAWWKKGRKAYSYSSLTGAQVYQLNLDGAELKGAKDGVWGLVYEFKPQRRKCVFGKCSAWVNGWTYPSSKTVYFNSLIWEGRSDCGIVGTIVHEQQHKLGLSHPAKATADRPFSPPYTQGTIAAELCPEFLAP